MKRKERNIEEELKMSFDKWNYLFVHGGSDPFWSDGCNLNLVRNHIIYYKKQLKEQNNFPKIYYKETPPEVNKNYMARVDEIKKNASFSLEAYLASEDYIYLLNNIQKLNSKQIKETCVSNVIGYVNGLRQFILSNDLVCMRRHEDPLGYLESLHECRIKVEKILKITYNNYRFISRNQICGQLSFNDFLT